MHDGTEYVPGCRGRAEIEAESVADILEAGATLATIVAGGETAGHEDEIRQAG